MRFPHGTGDLVAGSFRCVRLCGLLSISGALFAQSAQPTADWVRSPEPIKQAWGAHIIAGQKLTTLVPELLRVVESPDTSTDGNAAKFAALDTLIQLDVQVPLRDLEPLVDRFPTDVLILAARTHEDATALLLKLLDRQHNQEAFVAVGNLLTPKRIAGFAKAAMKEFCQFATVSVYNPHQRRHGEVAFAGDALAVPNSPRVGWPETGTYRLHEEGANRSATLLADGSHPVSFHRTPTLSYVDHGFDYLSDGSGDNSCLRAEEFLATYLETSPRQLPIRTEANLDVDWTTAAALETAVRKFIAEQRARYGLLAGQLAARGYLTADDAAKARLNMRIFADDARTHDRTLLPGIAQWAKDAK